MDCEFCLYFLCIPSFGYCCVCTCKRTRANHLIFCFLFFSLREKTVELDPQMVRTYILSLFQKKKGKKRHSPGYFVCKISWSACAFPTWRKKKHASQLKNCTLSSLGLQGAYLKTLFIEIQYYTHERRKRAEGLRGKRSGQPSHYCQALASVLLST